MPEYTTFTFHPFGGAPGPNPIHSDAMVLSDKHIDKEGTSYIIWRRERHVEITKGGAKRGVTPVVLSVFDIIESESGQVTVPVTRYGPHTSPGGILYTVHSPCVFACTVVFLFLLTLS